MKTLKFKGFKVDLILSGEKTASMRLFDDKDLKEGDELELINSDTKEVFAHAVITEILTRKLRDITEADLEGHELITDNDMTFAVGCRVLDRAGWLPRKVTSTSASWSMPALAIDEEEHPE